MRALQFLLGEGIYKYHGGMIQEWGSKYRLASGKDVPRGQPGHYDGIELLTKVDDVFLLIDRGGYLHAPYL